MDGRVSHFNTSQCSISRWVLIRMALLTLVVSLVIILAGQTWLERRFDRFDAKLLRQQLIRVNTAIAQDKKALESTIADYAYWDDAEQFILGNKPHFMRDNFLVESMKNINVNAVIVTNTERQAIASVMVLPNNLLGDIEEPLFSQLEQELLKLKSRLTKKANSFLFWQNDSAYLVASVAVTDTLGLNEPSGYLFFVRTYDKAGLARLQTLTQVDFELTPNNDVHNLEIHKVDTDPILWEARQSIEGLAGDINIRAKGKLADERDASSFLVVYSVIFVALFCLLVTYFMLHFRVLRRLGQFSRLADELRGGNNSVRWPAQGNDELDNLALSMNTLLDEIDSRHNDLTYLAEHDPLTGLGNRRLLMSQMDAIHYQQHRNSTFQASMVLFDLDSFKLLNDGLGHAAGDFVLKLVARRILSVIRRCDTAVRLGGDEFAILLREMSTKEALEFVERLSVQLREPFSYNGSTISVRASAGISVITLDMSKEDIIRNADLAMYEAKRKSQGGAAVFDTSMLSEVSRRVQLEQALQRTVKDDGIEVWYQPIVDGNTGHIKGLEALCRWPLDGNYIPPDEFITIAEETGLISELGQLIFRRVCRDLVEIRDLHPNLSCNVNLSIKQFANVNFVRDVAADLAKFSLPSSAINFELTENMVAESINEVLPTMKLLVAQGFSFHLDDFGTGYSSLERLRTLPFDTLKIDRSFVQALRNGEDIMVRHIINMATELGMTLIAEGVESSVELERLLGLGCDHIQGYYFAKPMPLNLLSIWLAKNNDNGLLEDTQIEKVAIA